MLSFVSENVKCFTIETCLEKKRILYTHKVTIGNKDQFISKEATSGIYS